MKAPEFHGMTGTPEYNTWYGMLARCRNPNHVGYPDYGGRGITVCKRWEDSFEAFYSDMGPRPTPEHSIDRWPNKDGNYEPGNCRWATPTEQARNTSKTVFLTFKGERLPLAELSERTGVSRMLIKYRLRNGMTVEDAVKPPIERYEYQGQSRTLKEWSKITGLKYHTLYGRVVTSGWSMEDALSKPIQSGMGPSRKK